MPPGGGNGGMLGGIPPGPPGPMFGSGKGGMLGGIFGGMLGAVILSVQNIVVCRVDLRPPRPMNGGGMPGIPTAH
jgi:hypothetical protein